MADGVVVEGRFGAYVTDDVIFAKTEMTSDDVADFLLVAGVIVVVVADDGVNGRPVLEVLVADTFRRLYFAQQSRSTGRYRNSGNRVEVREAIANRRRPEPLYLDDHQTVDQQEADEGVLAGEENVCVAEAVVLEDQQQAEYEIRKVLHRNRDENPVEVWRTAGITTSRRRRRRRLTLKDSDVKVIFADATGNEAAFVSASFRCGDDDGELKKTPRPNRQNNDTQRTIIANLRNGNRLTLYSNPQFRQAFNYITYIVF